MGLKLEKKEENKLFYSKTKYYQKLNEKEKKKVTDKIHLDFNICKNKNLAKEIEEYIFSDLDNKEKSLITVVENNGSFKKILSIISEYEEKSFTEMTYEEAKNKFKEECLRIGIATKIKHVKYKGTENERKTFKDSKIIILYNSILNHYKEKKYSEYKFENDIWYLDKMPIKIEGQLKSKKIHTLNFEGFRNDDLKEIVKKYIFQIMNNRKISTVTTHLSLLKTLGVFLNKEQLNKVEEIDKSIIEKFVSAIANGDFSEEGKKGSLNILKSFLFSCKYNKAFPLEEKDLLNINFTYRATKINPKYIDDFVMKQFMTHFVKMDELAMDITYLLMNTGMRISEVMELPIGSIKKDFEGDYFLTYYQHKVEEENRIPIKEELANVILKRENITKKTYGEDARYLFAKNKEEPMNTRSYANKLRNFCREKELKDKNGNAFTISPHMFRSTLVTNYVNNGMKPDLIRKLIGHNSYDTINRYMEIHDTTLKKEMDHILDFQNEMILNMGKEIKREKQDVQEGIPLPNGTCMKPLTEGDCQHINKCFTCAMFKPSIEDLNVFMKQLEEVERNLVICKEKGFQRMIEKNEEMRSSIINIIKKIRR